jgi:hypothetical protein
MAEQVTPYIPAKPGDLISAQDWNGVQEQVKEDIAKRIGTAVAAIKTVDRSHDAEKLGGQTPDDLAKYILDYVTRQLPKRTGYLAVFKELKAGVESVVTHKLGAFPLDDVYQLDYFDVVASEDGHITTESATFFLHHASERTIRFRGEGDSPSSTVTPVPIDPPDGHPYHIPFKHMLELYGVETPDDAPLGDIETEFWQAFNSAPNDQFGDDQIFHSPWFDRCCREERTWHALARDIDEMFVQCRPRKTINYTAPATAVAKGGDAKLPSLVPGAVPAAPTMVQVTQFDFDSVGLRFLRPPNPSEHLKVLVLLKV